MAASADSVPWGERILKLRCAGTCRRCQARLASGTQAIYQPASKTVRCMECRSEDDPVDHGSIRYPEAEVVRGAAGASARREHELQVARRETRVREAHPKIGGLLLTVSSEPPSTTAWAVGAIGEERLGARLDHAASATLRVLHDRRMPRSRANIDHLAVTPSGVYVIDAKR